MGVRPPPSDDDDSGPASVDFGIAALAGRLDGADVQFPATSAELVAALGDPDVPYDPHGNAVPLRDVLDRVPVDEFDSQKELLNTLHPVFEELRTSSGSGLLSWVRSFLPG